MAESSLKKNMARGIACAVFLLLIVLTIKFVLPFRITERKVIKAEGCSITFPKSTLQPIITNASTLEFVYPSEKKTVIVYFNKTLLIGCSRSKLKTGQNSIIATCTDKGEFKVDGKIMNLNDLACAKTEYHLARATNKTCEMNGTEIEIGWDLGNDQYIRQLLVCFDKTNESPLYSYYNLTHKIDQREAGSSRPKFVEDKQFYSLAKGIINSKYTRKNQRRTINNLLGLDPSSTKYIKDDNNFFLSRGHLSAKADFVYSSQQVATFHYINAAPQWQTFNGANWNQAEMDVRTYAEENEVDLRVYTGTFGVATLPHEETKQEIPLYLYTDEDGHKALPVPQLYWKVVYNPKSKAGIILIGVNNPYISEDSISNQLICPDVSGNITWLHWNNDKIKKGYSYVCDVNEARKFIKYIPDFEVTSLLM